MEQQSNETLRLSINGRDVVAKQGQTVLEAALDAGIYVPNLCYHPDLEPSGSCRLCIVEIEGRRDMPPSCVTKVAQGMVVETDSPQVRELRKNLIWLLLSEYPGAAEDPGQFQKLVEYIGRKKLLARQLNTPGTRTVHDDEPLYVRDPNKCVLCGRCVQICHDVRGVGAIGFTRRGIEAEVGPAYEGRMEDSACRFCGACVEVCPTGALRDVDPCPSAEREETILACRTACPAGVDIPRYVNLIAQGRFQDALEVIRTRVPFPHTLGLVCDHPCEGSCRRQALTKPVAVRALKRFVAEHDNGRWRDKIRVAPDTGKKVAVVGSGPAGLTAAWFLRLKGHAVTVFEALPQLGGMLRVGIPRYRLVGEVLDREIADIAAVGVELKPGTRVDSLEALLDQGYDAVFIGVGAPRGISLGMPGEEDPRVLDGITTLRKIALGDDPDITGEVAVVGGGNVAMDVARSALRVGATSVTVVYRRTREEMPAYEQEIEDALEEGVDIQYLTNPSRVIRGEDRLGVECIRMELGEPDESGRRRPVPIEGSEFVLEVDRLLVAIGQQSDVPDDFGVAVNKRGRIEIVLDTGATNRPGVFSGGDVESGPASVVKAISAGRRAAASIDRYLGGDGVVEQQLVEADAPNPYLGLEPDFARRERADQPVLPREKRLAGFDEVELGFDEQTAMAEAQRCMRCQLRLEIAKAPMPPEPAETA